MSTPRSFIRLFEAYVIEGNTNVGNISVYDNTETYELLRLDAGESDAHAAIHTVPANHKGYIVQWHGSEVANQEVEFVIQEVEFAIWSRKIGTNIWRLRRKLIIGNNLFHLPFQIPIQFEEKTDISMMVKAGQTTSVTGGFEGYSREDD